MVVLIGDYGLTLPHVGTSPQIFDKRSRASARWLSSRQAERPSADESLSLMALSAGDQAREVLAALSLNKSQLSDVLGVSRPTVYDWLDGKEPNVSNAERLTALLRLLARAHVTSSNPLNARFVRSSLAQGGPSLLDVLSVDPLDEDQAFALLREARRLSEDAASRRTKREERLRALEFEDPPDEQRKEQLRSVARV